MEAAGEVAAAADLLHHGGHGVGTVPTYDEQMLSVVDGCQDAAYTAAPSANKAAYPTEEGGEHLMVDHTLDAEVARLHEMTADAKTHEDEPTDNPMGQEGEEPQEDEGDDEVNKRSVYVGNVDYGSTPQELQEHFSNCGKIFRVTIMVDKYTGHPKGFAYIEFGDVAAANNALMLSNTTLRGRQIKVSLKRKNIAGMTRGRGFSGRGRGRGAVYYGAAPFAVAPPFLPGRGFPASRAGYGPRFRGRIARRPRGAPY